MALIERTTDSGVAHGLRQHSIGGTFPAIVVGRGDGSTDVHLGNNIRKCSSVSRAFELAERVGAVFRATDWKGAVSVLKHYPN